MTGRDGGHFLVLIAALKNTLVRGEGLCDFLGAIKKSFGFGTRLYVLAFGFDKWSSPICLDLPFFSEEPSIEIVRCIKNGRATLRG